MNNMPPVTKNLLIINLLFFAGRWVAKLYGIDLDDILGLHFLLADNFHFYQIFTYMFMHGGFEHLFFNMFAVWMFGRIMETTMGSKRFLFYYLSCGLGAGLMQEVVQYGQYLYMGLGQYDEISISGLIIDTEQYLNRWTTVGASGAVYGILLSFGMTFPEERMFIFPLPVPIKAKYFVMGYAVIELLSALGNSNDGVAHFAHLGGMLFGLLLILYWRNGGGSRNRRGGGGFYDRGNGFGSGGRGFRRWFSETFQREKPHFTTTQGGAYGRSSDSRMNPKQDEDISDILNKISKGGYSSLTEEEKKRLFRKNNSGK